MPSENEELEKYNEELNRKLSNREVTNLRTCPQCNGKGHFYCSVCSPEVWMCHLCHGEKYIKGEDYEAGSSA